MTAESISSFLLARITEDEEAARLCAGMFPPPWDVADRGWRVRIYGSDVAVEDFSSDDPDAMATRNPVVMEVEPDRHIEDPRWLSERVAHIARHDPARVLSECAAKRAIVDAHEAWDESTESFSPDYWAAPMSAVVEALAAVYSDHPEFREEWKP